jgi:hypothetical protein
MQRFSMQRFGLVMLASLLVAVLGACSSGGSGSSTADKSTSSSGSSAEATAASAAAVAPAPGLVTGSSDASSAGGTTASQSAASGSTAAVNWDRMIIRNASITLQVTNVESMLATVRGITDGAGGLVFASSTSFDGDNQIATITLDVPAEKFDQVVNSLRSAPGVKKVQSEAVASQDVTDEYVDLQSKLKSLNASQDRLLELIKGATNINDILTLDDHLTDIQSQIDQINGRINYIDKKTSFSRITLTLSPVAIVVHQNNNGGFDLGEAVSSAWRSSLRFTGDVLTVGVKVVVFLWWVVPLAAIAFGIFALRRQRRDRAEPSAE